MQTLCAKISEYGVGNENASQLLFTQLDAVVVTF